MRDINHFLTVWSYAKTIGELEKLDEETQYVLEVAAVTHDIGCPLCREKYKSIEGPLQEKEGAVLVKEFLKDTTLTNQEIDRVSYLVGHHHTLSEIDGLDYQILIEADYIVNAAESNYSKENIENFCCKFFKTEAGIKLLKAVFP